MNSEDPYLPMRGARESVFAPAKFIESINQACEQQRLWSNYADAQAGLKMCCSKERTATFLTADSYLIILLHRTDSLLECLHPVGQCSKSCELYMFSVHKM